MQKLNLIFATDLNGLFGVSNRLPWKISSELQHFNRITNGSFDENILVMGRNTFESIPRKLENRKLVVISKTINEVNPNYKLIYDYNYTTLDSFIEDIDKTFPNKKIFIIGGAKIIEEVINKYFYLIDNIYYSEIQEHLILDPISHNANIFKYIDKNIIKKILNFINICKETKNNLDTITNKEYNIKYYHIKIPQHEEFQYLNLIKNCLENGDERQTRNAITHSMFNSNITFDLKKGFPLLTTKKVFMRGIFEELIFFLKGQTNSKILEEKGINIWKPNTTKEFIEKCKLNYEEGDMGPMYGYNWVHFGYPYEGCNSDYTNKGYNQLEYVINLLLNDPHSRRILMTTYDPANAGKGVLYPCHSLVIQFYVKEIQDKYYVSMNMYQRSVDLACGLPFNIASNALLLNLICDMLNKRIGKTKYVPDILNIILGDIHVYSQHKENALEQIKRMPYEFPKLEIKQSYEDITDYKFEDILLVNYQSHPAIKYEMVA